MNVKDLVIASKCRKGVAAGTTKSGAYWLACAPIKTRRAGGDGIGQSSADLTYTLELRHYRSGEVRAVIHVRAWHQNGDSNSYHQLPAILDCGTVEDVVVALKGGVSGDYGRETCCSDYCLSDVTEALTGLGLPEFAPSPDEV